MNQRSFRHSNRKNRSAANNLYRDRRLASATFHIQDQREARDDHWALSELANQSAQINQSYQLQTLADHHTDQNRVSKTSESNLTGMPDELKTGVESLSGISMDDVKVHYNSDKPARLNAHAFAQGTNIHLGTGQEKHLPHEAWHVVQQKQGRVKPTYSLKGENINDDQSLEQEADAKASILRSGIAGNANYPVSGSPSYSFGVSTSQFMVAQLAGDPPYQRNTGIQTNYISISFQHDLRKVASEDVDDYIVQRINIIGRPPVYLGGVKLENQGQHKVAWRAIWGALEQLIGFEINDAHEVLDEMITNSGVPMIDDNPNLQPIGGHNTPDILDNLVIKAHNYLCSKQRDDPSWESDDPDQLAGKGEMALKQPLKVWQNAVNLEDATTAKLFKIGDPMELKMSKLLDTTDREEDEVTDARERARKELYLQNPEAYVFFEELIDQWLATK